LSPGVSRSQSISFSSESGFVVYISSTTWTPTSTCLRSWQAGVFPFKSTPLVLTLTFVFIWPRVVSLGCCRRDPHACFFYGTVLKNVGLLVPSALPRPSYTDGISFECYFRTVSFTFNAPPSSRLELLYQRRGHDQWLPVSTPVPSEFSKTPGWWLSNRRLESSIAGSLPYARFLPGYRLTCRCRPLSATKESLCLLTFAPPCTGSNQV